MSANPGFYEVDCNHQGLVVAGSFAVDVAGAPAYLRGSGFSVAHTTTGVYTITFTDSFLSLYNFVGSTDNLADDIILGGPVDLSAKTAVIYRWDLSAGALENMVTVNERVSFRFCFGVRA